MSDLRNLKSRLLDIHSPLGRLSIVLLLCIAVVPLNPNGASMYIYPFDTLGSRAMQAFIQEWFSPDFHLPEWQPFAWLLLATLGAVSLSGKRLSLTQALLLVGLGYASLRSVRIIPLFALVAAPVLSEQLWTILSSRSWFSAPKESRLTRGTALLNWIVLLLILVAGLARVSSVIGNQATVEMDKFPTAAASFLNSKPNTGALYNAYAWGGYLIWRLYPQQRVFIDGRADVYGDAFVEEFLQAWRGGTGWQAPLEKYGIRTILIESDAPLATQLARDASWRQVYTDRQATIFQRN